MGTSSLLTELGGVPVATAFGDMTMAGGKVFFVNPAVSASGNGRSPARAFKTLKEGYDACTDGANDTVALVGSGTATTIATAGLTWSKSYTHLVGICAPTQFGQRARVFLTAASAAVSMLEISGTGCVFRNLYFFHGVASTSSLNCVFLNGAQRCSFENVHFAGIGHDTGQGDVAAARSLLLTAANENTFYHCTIGCDTVARSTTNAELELTAYSTRNKFENCLFLSYADNNGHLFVKAAATHGIDRFLIFEHCTFLNAYRSAATLMTQAFSVAAAVGGLILLKDCSLYGCTDWETSASTNVFIDGAAPTGNTSGLAVTVA